MSFNLGELQILPIPCRGGGAVSLLRLTTSCPLSPDTRYPARCWAGGRWCRALQNYLSLETAPRHCTVGCFSASPRDAGPVSSGGGCVLQSCSKTWASCSHSQWAAAGPASSWGQGKLYQCQGHAAGHWVDTHLLLSLSGHGMETETPRHPPMSPLNIDVVTLHRDA